MSASPTPNREARLEAVLQAATYLLGARQDQMLSIEEWADLSRAVAACHQRQTAEYLTDHDLEDIAGCHGLAWDEGSDGALPTAEEP